jgi:hypothetical protein
MRLLHLIPIILLVSSSCKKEDRKYCTPEEKSWLFYSQFAQFKLLRNGNDTIVMRADKIKRHDDDYNGQTGERLELRLFRESQFESSLKGLIAYSNVDARFWFQFTSGSFIDSSLFYPYTNAKNFYVKDFIEIGDTLLHLTNYSHVYLFAKERDTLYFSKQKGIIQIKLNRSHDIFNLIEP